MRSSLVKLVSTNNAYRDDIRKYRAYKLVTCGIIEVYLLTKLCYDYTQRKFDLHQQLRIHSRNTRLRCHVCYPRPRKIHTVLPLFVFVFPAIFKFRSRIRLSPNFAYM